LTIRNGEIAIGVIGVTRRRKDVEETVTRKMTM
jgi:hypothetical protein